jgi:hypothetical protein
MRKVLYSFIFMQKHVIFFFFFFAVLLFASCKIVIIQHAPGHLEYNNVRMDDRQKMVFISDSVPLLQLPIDSPYIYVIRAEQLKNYMDNFDSCLIYEFSSRCSSKYCFSPIAVQQLATECHYKFILLLDSFLDIASIPYIAPKIDKPIFAINENDYPTSKHDNHTNELFLKSFYGAQSVEKNIWSSRYLIYKEGQFSSAEQIVIQAMK